MVFEICEDVNLTGVDGDAEVSVRKQQQTIS
jgi:hypothetical protein